MTAIKEISFREYVNEVLKNAIYERDNSLGEIPCVVAEAPDLPGCFTQGENFEEARESLVDAIELWIMAGLKSGEQVPIVNSYKLALMVYEQTKFFSSANETSDTRNKRSYYDARWGFPRGLGTQHIVIPNSKLAQSGPINTSAHSYPPHPPRLKFHL